MPARIVLVKVPERTEIRQKNLFSVSDVNIFWHPQVRPALPLLVPRLRWWSLDQDFGPWLRLRPQG